MSSEERKMDIDESDASTEKEDYVMTPNGSPKRDAHLTPTLDPPTASLKHKLNEPEGQQQEIKHEIAKEQTPLTDNTRTESPEPGVFQQLAKKQKTESPTPQPIPLTTSTGTTASKSKESTPISGESHAHNTGANHHSSNHRHNNTQNNTASGSAKSNRPKYEIIDGSEVRVFLNRYVTDYLTSSLNQIVSDWENGKLFKNENADGEIKAKEEEETGNASTNCDAKKQLGINIKDGDVLLKLGEMLVEKGKLLNEDKIKSDDDNAA